ncbi:MAG: helix-turn-helix transcriptional regulator [Rhodobacteraceae bacterium]|nr:helix-turn-helix transcriptional regulator [Paracoccaceae bacterium]MBR9820871.1 helix-turn-helix transcriptional regulator [Paracoccaceae bacterium]
MLFVPLPLFATLALTCALIHLIRTRDMSLAAHRLFAAVVAVYAVQSLLLCLRWGYALAWAAAPIALLAPCLPVLVYLAYGALTHMPRGRRLWPVGVVALNWAIWLMLPALADAAIPATYIGFGLHLLWVSRGGSDALPLSRLADAPGAVVASRLTGAALVASGVTDIYLIADFIRTGGTSAGLVVTIMQTLFAVVIGLSATRGRSSAGAEPESDQVVRPTGPTEDDTAIVARLTALIRAEGLHRHADLSLRKLARRLHLPDRSVSMAVNRVTGLNLSQFVNDFRIAEACRLLRATDATILDISLAAGFATKSNFNREFMRVTGQTPSAWRQEQPARSPDTPDRQAPSSAPSEAHVPLGTRRS